MNINITDVVIIGANISGLIAAHTILSIDPQLYVLVLDENDSICSSHTKYVPTARGLEALEVHSPSVNNSQLNLVELCDKLNVKLMNKPSGSVILDVSSSNWSKFYKDLATSGDPIKNTDFLQFLAKFENLIAKITFNNINNSELCKKLDGTTMEDYLRQNLKLKRNQDIMRNIVYIYTGMSSKDLSVLYFTAFCNSTSGIYTLLNLNSKSWKYLKNKQNKLDICEILQEKIGKRNVLKNEKVTQIRKVDNNDFIVKTANNRYSTRCIVVAVSPRSVTNITFEPKLPEVKSKMLNEMNERRKIQFIATYDKAFWTEKDLCGYIFSTQNVKGNVFSNCFDISNENVKALSGFLFDSTQDNVHKSEVLKQLSKYFGEQALKPNYYEEFLSNANYCPVLGTTKNFVDIRQPYGRIFFCGSYSSSYWPNFLAGSIQSGYRAGIEVLYDIRPQALQIRDILKINPNKKFSGKYTTMSVNKLRNWKFYVPIGIGITIFIFRKRIGNLLYNFVKTQNSVPAVPIVNNTET